MTRLAIVDDNPIEVTGLKLILKHKCDDIQVISKSLFQLGEVKKFRPNVVLIDIGSAEFSPADFCQRLKKELPATKILWLLQHKNPEIDEETQLKALTTEIDGCVFKSEIGQIVRAIKVVQEDDYYFPRALMAKWLHKTVALSGADLKMEVLTPREKQICKLVDLGKTNQEIAKELDLGVETVKAHVKHIRKKLNIKSKRQIVYTTGCCEEE